MLDDVIQLDEVPDVLGRSTRGCAIVPQDGVLDGVVLGNHVTGSCLYESEN